MAGTFPTTPKPQSVSVQIVTPAQSSESFSGNIRRVAFGHQYYVLDVKYAPMTPYQFGSVIAFSAKQYGIVDSFQVILPEISYNTGTGAAGIGSPKVTSALAAGVKTCTINGLTPNTMQVLRAGDYFKFNNHNKVYMAVDDLNADGGGSGILNFAGALMTAVPVNTGITTNAVPFTVIFESPIQEYSIGYGGMTNYSVRMREVW